MDLAGKSALVTGGTDWIGAQIVLHLRDKRVTVMTKARDTADQANVGMVKLL